MRQMGHRAPGVGEHMTYRDTSLRIPSATFAVGAATLFIAVATAIGLLPDQTARPTPGAATWELRGSVSPLGPHIPTGVATGVTMDRRPRSGHCKRT